MNAYEIIIFYSAEDGGYIAEIPDLPGCSAFAGSPDRAVAEVVVAKHAWLEAAARVGLPAPEPRYRAAPAG